MNNYEHRSKPIYASYTFQVLMSFCLHIYPVLQITDMFIINSCKKTLPKIYQLINKFYLYAEITNGMLTIMYKLILKILTEIAFKAKKFSLNMLEKKYHRLVA